MIALRLPLTLLLLTFCLFSAQLRAANTDTVTVNVEFVAAISVTAGVALDFGLISTDLANTETIVIDTAGSATDSNSRLIGGSTQAGTATITATAVQAATITVTESGSGTGYSLGTFVCSYNSVDGNCSAGYAVTTVASDVVEIGATLTGDGLDAAGVANSAIDITMVYN